MTAPDRLRLLLRLQYDGTRFFGWQIQPRTRTVQGELTTVILRLAREAGPLTGAGRTDRGVHATGQVASVSLPRGRWSPDSFRRSMNALLPDDIWVEAAQEVPAGFHPRHDAVARSYEYRVGQGPEAFSPFHLPWCWPMEERLSLSVLRSAALLLPGTRSYRAFARAGQPARGDRCTVRSATWDSWDGAGEGSGLLFRITANRYLHHMVRYLVGTMVEVALGRRPLDEMEALLDAQDGVVTSPPAPPSGLFLVRVEYPDQALVP